MPKGIFNNNFVGILSKNSVNVTNISKGMYRDLNNSTPNGCQINPIIKNNPPSMVEIGTVHKIRQLIKGLKGFIRPNL